VPPQGFARLAPLKYLRWRHLLVLYSRLLRLLVSTLVWPSLPDHGARLRPLSTLPFASLHMRPGSTAACSILVTPPAPPLCAGVAFVNSISEQPGMRQWQQVLQALLGPAVQGFMNCTFLPLPFR
jgi:hypothetical protein